MGFNEHTCGASEVYISVQNSLCGTFGSLRAFNPCIARCNTLLWSTSLRMCTRKHGLAGTGAAHARGLSFWPSGSEVALSA